MPKKANEIVENCLFNMKWSQNKSDNNTTNQNRTLLKDLGLTNYWNQSINPESGLIPSTELIVLVIVRWHDTESRNFVRKTIDYKNTSHTNNIDIQVLFVFGFPESATKQDLINLKNENEIHHDMIIPCKY